MSSLSVTRTYMLYVLCTFLLPVRKGSYVIARYLYIFEKNKANIKWSWGSVVLAHLFHNLGAVSRTDGKQFGAYTTLLEVVWDPYRAKKRSDHDFNENTFFNGLISSPDHVKPIYPNRIIRQFARIQPISKNPKCFEVLRTWDGEEPKQYKPKYDWVDVFLKGLWKELILAVIPKGELVPSRDLQKKIDELTVKYVDAVKRLKEKELFDAWCQAMKKEFYCRELAEKDDLTFIELFDQYDIFCTILQQGPKGDYLEDFTVTGEN
ncbi:hypothetical protein GIB67_015063 [Kingdonia uniflora]|uniref:Aminotransferase-like plant mobile domain-containing protein n=1 Tax=Kingdonia uniflora TaxID=39325 RepID=A0A7J7NMY5_9MAGN|nr:hypothetical protein GIB67_015063 [Kingdonia uniflora]